MVTFAVYSSIVSSYQENSPSTSCYDDCEVSSSANLQYTIECLEVFNILTFIATVIGIHVNVGAY